jgi:hypothetical protein
MPGPPSIFDTPHTASPAPSSLSNYIQPNLGHGLRIWWAFFWPTTVISAVLTIAVNSWLKALYESSNVPGRFLRPILKYDPYILSYAVAFFAMYYILRKNFRHFRIGLLSRRGGEGSEILETTLRRTARVWWTYSWRSFLYGLIATFVTAVPSAVLVGLFAWNRGLQSLVAVLVSTALGGAVGLFVIYSNILDEDFGDFRVCLLPRAEPNAVPGAPAANPAVS